MVGGLSSQPSLDAEMEMHHESFLIALNDLHGDLKWALQLFFQEIFSLFLLCCPVLLSRSFIPNVIASALVRPLPCALLAIFKDPEWDP